MIDMLDDGFDALWVIGAKKGSRLLAKAKFNGITSVDGLKTRMKDRESDTYIPVHLQASHETLLTGWKAYCYTKIGEDQYVQHLSTWLNRGGWEDIEEPERLAAKMDAVLAEMTDGLDARSALGRVIDMEIERRRRAR